MRFHFKGGPYDRRTEKFDKPIGTYFFVMVPVMNTYGRGFVLTEEASYKPEYKAEKHRYRLEKICDTDALYVHEGVE